MVHFFVEETLSIVGLFFFRNLIFIQNMLSSRIFQGKLPLISTVGINYTQDPGKHDMFKNT